MRDSRTTHHILTESGVPNSRHPHPRKGREGKGTGKGHLQDQVSQLTTAHAFGDWTWR